MNRHVNRKTSKVSKRASASNRSAADVFIIRVSNCFRRKFAPRALREFRVGIPRVLSIGLGRSRKISTKPGNPRTSNYLIVLDLACTVTFFIADGLLSKAEGNRIYILRVAIQGERILISNYLIGGSGILETRNDAQTARATRIIFVIFLKLDLPLYIYPERMIFSDILSLLGVVSYIYGMSLKSWRK